MQSVSLQCAVQVEDRTSAEGATMVREKADSSDVGSVGAPMAGDILSVCRCCLQFDGFGSCSIICTLVCIQ